MSQLDHLHAPLLPILRHALAIAPLPRAGLALDLACGPGLKMPLLADACGPDVRLIGVDIDRAAIHAATTDYRPPTTEDRGLKIEDSNLNVYKKLSSTFYPLSSQDLSLATHRSSVVGPRSSVVWAVGDALALPLREGCCAAAFCIGALSLFADRQTALRELRRVLAVGALAVLATSLQSWAQVIPWPSELAARLATAYAQTLADGHAPLPATPDLGEELAKLLFDVGLATPLVRAFLLDRPPTTDLRPPTNGEASNPHLPSPISHPLLAELPLLPWPGLRLRLAARLGAAELARCDAIAAEPEVELCSLLLVAQARAA